MKIALLTTLRQITAQLTEVESQVAAAPADGSRPAQEAAALEEQLATLGNALQSVRSVLL